MSRYGKMRGSQINIGKITVQIPPAIPTTNDEVVDREATIAIIQDEIAPYEAIVKGGKEIMDGLREDITDCMVSRLHADRVPDPKDVPLFKEEAAEMAQQKENERRPRVVDAIPAGDDMKMLPATTSTKKARKPRKPRAPREASRARRRESGPRSGAGYRDHPRAP